VRKYEEVVKEADIVVDVDMKHDKNVEVGRAGAGAAASGLEDGKYVEIDDLPYSISSLHHLDPHPSLH
jgi:hypothetical protein